MGRDSVLCSRQAFANVRGVRHLLSLDLVLAAGTPLILLGLVLGPGMGLLDRAALRALAPVTALVIGWIGAMFGARFEWRQVRRIPRNAWLLSVLSAAAVFVVVALAAWCLTRLIPALATAWDPPLPALVTLAAAAVAAGPDAVALVARAVGTRRRAARTFGLAAALEAACGAMAATIPLSLHRAHQPAGSAVVGWFVWAALAVGSGALVATVFIRLTRLRPAHGDLGFALFATLLFGAGIGSAAELSPFVVCALGTALIVNFSPWRRQVRGLLSSWEHPVLAIFLIMTGALLALPTVWILAAVPLLAALRAAAMWAGVRLARTPLRLGHLAPNAGLATAAQGSVALALGSNFFVTYAGQPQGAGAVLTAIVLGVAVSQLVGPSLMELALRPQSPPLTAPPAVAEVRG